MPQCPQMKRTSSAQHCVLSPALDVKTLLSDILEAPVCTVVIAMLASWLYVPISDISWSLCCKLASRCTTEEDFKNLRKL